MCTLVTPIGVAVASAPPRVLFSDDFGRANENLEASLSWTLESGSAGDVTIVSNALSNNTTSSNGGVYKLPTPPSADHWVEARNRTTTVNVGFICCRFLDVNNYVGMRLQTSGVMAIWKKVGGGFTSLGTGPAIADGDVLRLEVEGDEVRGYLNDVLVKSAVLSGDLADIAEYGLIGRVATASPWLDKFRAGRLRAP